MKKTFTLELADGYPIEFLDIPCVATNMPRAGEMEFIDTPRGKLAIPKRRVNYASLDFHKIASKYDVKVSQASDDECHDYSLFNGSFSCGREIVFGKYPVFSEENKAFAFFHELGHIASSRASFITSRLGHEFNAWAVAWNISRQEYNVTWSESAIRYAIRCLQTYAHDEE